MAAAVHVGAYAPPGAYAAPQTHHDPYGEDYDSDGAADGRPMVLVTTVDIGEGRAARVEVRAGDAPVDVARAFCARHGLPEAIVLPLAQHLEENLAENAAGSGSEGYGYESQEEEAAEPTGHRLPSPPPAAGIAASRSATAEASAPYAGAGGVQASAHSEPGLRARPASGASAASTIRPAAPRLPTKAGAGGAPAAPAAAAGALEADQDSPPLTYRPASTISARGAEYFNRPPPAAGRAGGAQSPDPAAGLSYRVATGAGLPAHSRLYADHFRKQQRLEEERRLRDLEIQLKTAQVHIAPASERLAGGRGAGTYRNYGERLYVEGRLDALRREQLAQRLKEEEARAELEAHPFHPAISKLAQQIKAGEAELPGGAASAYQRLYQRAGDTSAKRQVGYAPGRSATTAERMAAIRREQDEAEVAECSFRPQINARSLRMVEQRQQILRENGLPGFEQLYNDGQQRRLKLEALAAQAPEEATFRPRVNTSSVVLRKLLEGREGDGLLGGGGDVAARLLERGRRYQAKLAAAQREADEAPRDAATGRPLFQPKTYRAPHYERNPEGAPIGERLHGIKAEWDERAARVRDAQEARAAQAAASTYVNTKSERLVERLKRERFRAIFDYLRRGAPAPVLNLLEAVQDEAFMDTIDPEVRADVEFAARLLARAIARRQAQDASLQDCATSAPRPDSCRSRSSAASAAPGAAGFAQSTNGEVDAAGFVALMEDVIGRTKGLTRQYLLPMPSGRQKFEEPSFRPAIDPRSQVLAGRVRPDSLPAHELLYRTAEEMAARREELARAAEAAKLKDCLFRPVLVAAPKAKEGRAIKLAAELTQSKRATAEEEAPAGAAQQEAPPGAAPTGAKAKARGGAKAGSGGAAGKGEGALQFDHLERQINEALVRLSLSEEQVAASLRQAHSGGGPAPPPPPLALAGAQVGQSVDANGYRLDYRALLGSPSPDSLVPWSEAAHTAASSLGGFNPLDDAEGPVTVTWEDDDSQEVVAHLGEQPPAPAAFGSAVAPADGRDEELAGLDLHALASADLPEHAAEPASGQAAAAAAPPAAEGSDGGTEWVTPREQLASPGMSPLAGSSGR